MTTYYVSTIGSNTSPYDTWAKGATSIATALAAASAAGGGHTIWVRPGRYNNWDLAPSVVGAVGAENWLKGDYDGGAGSGATGFVVIDANNSGALRSNSVFAASNNWDYWGISGFYGCGDKASTATANFAPVSGNPTLNSLKIQKCMFWHMGGAQAFNNQSWTIVDTEGSISIDDCVFVGGYTYAVTISHVKSTGFPTNHPCVFTNVIMISMAGYNTLNMTGIGTSNYTKAKLVDCTVIATAARPWYGQNVSYNALTVQRGAAVGDFYSSLGITMTYTDSWGYFGPTASKPASATQLTQFPHLPPIPYLGSWSNAIGLCTTATSPLPSTDLFQQAKPNGTYRDAGAQEWISGEEPQAPTGHIAAAAAGGSGPTIGGRLIR